VDKDPYTHEDMVEGTTKAKVVEQCHYVPSIQKGVRRWSVLTAMEYHS